VKGKRPPMAYYCPHCGGPVHWGGFYQCTECERQIEMGQLVIGSEAAARIRARREAEARTGEEVTADGALF
jgi:hypothetical protein